MTDNITYECPNCHRVIGHTLSCPSRYEQPRTAPPASRAGGEREEWAIYSSTTSAILEHIQEQYPGAVGISVPSPPFGWGRHGIVVIPKDPKDREEARRMAESMITEHNQHSTLMEQRERLMKTLKTTAHNAADGSGLCWCEADDRVFGHQRKCTSIRRVVNEVLTAIEQEGERRG